MNIPARRALRHVLFATGALLALAACPPRPPAVPAVDPAAAERARAARRQVAGLADGGAVLAHELAARRDPRPEARELLLAIAERNAPPNGNADALFDPDGAFTPAAGAYVEAVLALATTLDGRAVPLLRDVLVAMSRREALADDQALAYDAGLQLLGSLAVHAGGDAETQILGDLLHLCDPEAFPARWLEKRAVKLRVASVVGADLWQRLLRERPACAGTAAPGCPEALDAAPAPPDPTTPFSEEAKLAELRTALDAPGLHPLRRLHRVLRTFACPLEITMTAAMESPPDPRVLAYEHWCGDYGAATDALGRLAHAEPPAYRDDTIRFLAERLDKAFFKDPETGGPIAYDQYMNARIYTYVMYRKAAAQALGVAGVPDPAALDALRTVVFDELDHPQVGIPAGTSLGIVADAATLDRIVAAFVSSDTIPDVRGYLFRALDAHFRFAGLDELVPPDPAAERRAIDRLMIWVDGYQGDLPGLATSRLYVFGVLFGSAARDAAVAQRLVELTAGPDARTRELALLALECSTDRATAEPVFRDVYGPTVPDGPRAALRAEVTLRTLSDVYANVGTPHDPYTIPLRAAVEIADGTLFRRLDVLHALADLGHPEYLDSYTQGLAQRLPPDYVAEGDAGQIEPWELLALRDSLTCFETPYLEWLAALYDFAADPGNDPRFRTHAAELLLGLGERGYLEALGEALAASGSSDADRALGEQVARLLAAAPQP